VECKQAQMWLPAYGDGELDLAHTLEVEAHLHDCPACTALHQRQDALSKAVRGAGEYYPAPDNLRRKIRAALDEKAPEARPRFQWWPALAAATAMACVLVVGWLVWRQPGHEQLLAAQVLDRHLGSLQATHLTDVPSSDHHAVKPWFAGKLDFAPPVPEFPDQAFVLTGGRLDHLDGRAVAALVYKRREHVINLFVWPNAASTILRTFDSNGYHLISWTQSGMAYWAVSDLNPEELKGFVKRIRGEP